MPEKLQPIRATSAANFGRVWLITVAAASLLFPVISALWINYYGGAEPAWINRLYQQKEVALARRAGSDRRIIILGGSGALFSIDAELIEKKLGIPTVNFGTHAGMGLRYLLDRVRRELRRGDIVLLSPEYSAWDDSYRDTLGPALQYIWTYNKSYLLQINPLEAGKMVCAIPWADWPRSAKGWFDRLWGDSSHFSQMSTYCTATLSPCGDMGITSSPSAQQPTAMPFPTDPNISGSNAIREFGKYAQSHDVKLFLTWPSFVRPASISPPPAFLVDVPRQSGFVLLDSPADNLYPVDWFMDSPYHANPCCRRIRTEELIRRLRPQLGLPPAPEKPTGIFLLAGTDHRMTPGNIFADDPGIVVRQLEQGTAAQYARAGVPVYADSEAAKSMLASAGLATKLQSNQQLTIAQWFARYPKNIFCIAAASSHAIDPAWKGAVPDAIYNKLSSSEPNIAWFGSGAYANGAGARSGELNANLSSLFPKTEILPTSVSLRSDTSGARILVDDYQFISSTTGVCVIVIDPQMGIVLDRAVFGSRPEIETWHLWRVVG